MNCIACEKETGSVLVLCDACALEATERRLSKSIVLLSWLRDGIQHFTEDEDQEQVKHLCDAIDAFLKKVGGE